MSVIEDYLAGLSGGEEVIIAHMYGIVREVVPEATEEMSYAMPAFKYKGKSLVAITARKDFMSLYPFESIDRLGLDLSNFECTAGSIHFSPENPIPDDLLRKIITTRKRQIDG